MYAMLLLGLAGGADVPPVFQFPPVIMVGVDARPVEVVPVRMPPPPPVVRQAVWELRKVCVNGVCRVMMVPVVRER